MEIYEKQILYRETQYTDLMGVIKNIREGYLERLKSNNSPLFRMLEVKADNQLQISYCDEIYLFDFSIVNDGSDDLLINGQMFRLKRGVNVDFNRDFYELVGDGIYFDDRYLYKKEKNILEITNVYVLDGIGNAIFDVLLHNFDR